MIHPHPLKALSGLALALLFSLALTPAQTLAGEVVKLDNAALERAMDDGVVLIDVRTEREWAKTGVVPGAHRLTFFDEQGNYDAQRWLDALASIAGSDQPVAIICHSGVRSHKVSGFLARHAGYTEVYDATGGIVAWTREGRPVQR